MLFSTKTPLAAPVRGSNMLTALAIECGAMCRTFSNAMRLSATVLGDVGKPLNLLGRLVPACLR